MAMQLVTMKYIQNEMKVFYKSNNALLMIGLPGIGKTEIIHQELLSILTKELGNEEDAKEAMFSIDMSGIPADGLVMPYLDIHAEDGQRLKRDLIAELKAAKNWLETHETGKAAFFVDEITSANQDDQRTLMNFIQSGILPDGSKVDIDRLWFVLAGNPSPDMPGYEDYDGATHPIENAVITRAGTFFVEAKLSDLLDWGVLTNSKGYSNLHPYLVSALQKDPSMYMKEDDKDVRLLNSRTASKLSSYFYAASELGTQWNRSSVKSFVGDQIGDTLSSIIGQLDKLVGISELFGPDSSKELNKTALEKFKDMDDFQKYFVLATATDDSSPVSFKKKPNVVKFKKLLENGDVPPETILAIARRVTTSAPKSNARQLMAASLLKDPETNIQEHFRNVKRVSTMIR